MSTRQDVLEKAREYFETNFKQQEFIPGKTYIPVTGKLLDSADLESLIDASLDLWLTAGRFSREFESMIATYFNRSTSGIFVNSGSSANLVALSALGAPMMKSMKMEPIEKGSEIITAAAGFPTTVNPIIQNGWIPVFVDVEEKTLNSTLDLIKQARTQKTKAVVLAHTLGNPFRADEVAEWCKKEGLYLIEDCCDALGAKINGSPVGSFGQYATLSFYPAHHITTGEGGAVISQDGKLRKVAESIRDWGRDCWCEPGKDNTCGKRFSYSLGSLPQGYDHKYTYSNIGYNLKATDMQAAIGISQLKKLEKYVEVRRKNWKLLFDGVISSPILREHFTPVAPTNQTEPSWFGFPLHCSPSLNREKIITYLEKNQIGTRLLFGGNLSRQPAYAHVDYKISGHLDATDRIMKHTFWLGVHPSIDELKIAYMLEQLEMAVKQNRVLS